MQIMDAPAEASSYLDVVVVETGFDDLDFDNLDHEKNIYGPYASSHVGASVATGDQYETNFKKKTLTVAQMGHAYVIPFSSGNETPDQHDYMQPSSLLLDGDMYSEVDVDFDGKKYAVRQSEVRIRI